VECVFCGIVRGEAPCFKVYEDELTLAFMDIQPVADGHALVVTKQHFANIFEASPEALSAVTATAGRVARAIRQELGPEGLMVFQLNGAAAGQTVFHYHVHLIPRSSGDALRLHSRVRGEDAELLRIAKLLASRCH
jgi:histidine triad (HIT) family protein